MTAALAVGKMPSGVEAESPTGKSYVAFLPRDAWYPYAGWYVTGQFDNTQYQIQVYNPTTNTWDVVVNWTSIDAGDLHTHMNNLAGCWRTYRLVSTKPVQAIVTSGEGSNMVPAYTTNRYIGKDFTFLANYKSVLGGTPPENNFVAPYSAVIFGLEDNTRVIIELWKDNGDGKFDLSNPQPDMLFERREYTINNGEHCTFAAWETDVTQREKITMFWRVTSDKDVLPMRLSGDGDEDDRAITIEGRTFGKIFYFAHPTPFNLGFRVTNLENTPATISVLDVLNPQNPRLMGTYTVPAKGFLSIPSSNAFQLDSNGNRYVKLVSDKVVTVIAGLNELRGDNIFPVPSANGMIEYITNMIFGWEGHWEDAGEDHPLYNEFVAVDESDSKIDITPSINVSWKTMSYYSAGVKNRVYYLQNGVAKEAILSPGRNSISFGSNTYLTGFYVESGTNVVWGGIGSRTGEQWRFTSENRFVLYQGGNGNCWILGITSPDPWVEMDKEVECFTEEFKYKFIIEIKNFGPQPICDVQVTDVLVPGLEYIECSATLRCNPSIHCNCPQLENCQLCEGCQLPGDCLPFDCPPPSSCEPIPGCSFPECKPIDPVVDGQKLTFFIGEMSTGGPVEPTVVTLEFEVKATQEIPEGSKNTAEVTYRYWEPYWEWTCKVMSDTEPLCYTPPPPPPPPEEGTIVIDKFLDINEDGIWGEDEPPLQGIEFCAYDMINNGDPICETTDENGRVVLRLPPGEYCIEISDDKGYKVTWWDIPCPIVVEPGGYYEFVVGDWIEPPLNCCLFEGKGYWKHQLNVYYQCSGNPPGNPQETLEDIRDWMDLIYILHFPEIFGSDDLLYVNSTDQGGYNACEILQSGEGNNDPEKKLRAHLLTLEFNFVSGKADNCDEYDEDAVEQLIWIAEWALKNQREDLYEYLKDMIEFMNENPLGTIVVKNFLDTNQNGIKDEDEPLIPPGWDNFMEIQLCRMDNDGNLIDCRSPEIDENGFATFSGLTPDTYYVNVLENSDELEVTTELPIGPIHVECDSHESWVGIWWINPPTPPACDQRGLGYWKEQIDWYWEKGKNQAKNKIPKEDLLAWMDEINALFFSHVFGNDDEVEQCEIIGGIEVCEIHSYPVSSLTPENALWIFELGPGNHSPAERLRQHLLAAEFNHVSGKFYCNGDEEQKYLIELFLWTAEWILINVDPDTEEGKALYDQWKNWIEELNETGNSNIYII
jgi:uncharacterized repeat protein (TIGR01451 family)